jgi:pimeloyl-ACP methyl ester carboxylesterase
MEKIGKSLLPLRRRNAIETLLASGLLAANCWPTEVQAAEKQRKPAFVLVHGSWHGAWCFGRITPYLERAGHAVVAPDLPGHGLNARFPRSYGHRPLDAAQFASEKSLIADETLADYATTVAAAVEHAYSLGGGPVILLGHSMGGLPITLVGEAIPQKIKKIVYLTAFMMPDGTSVGTFATDPQGEGAKTAAVMRSDPSVTGALRIDPHSEDPTYVASLKAALAADLSDSDWNAVRNLLTPDVPVGLFGTVVRTTKERWGRVPRVFIRCTEDYAIRPGLQDKFIALADAATPRNLTEVHTLPTSHSAFISRPAELANILLKLSA